MERRKFLNQTGCALAGIATAPAVMAGKDVPQSNSKPEYEIEIEIYEAREDTWCHKKGDMFKWPDDMGKICPWLRSSLHDFVRLLNEGVTLTWKYAGTPYEKVIDPEGITTEYVRCPDPTADLVAKIIRTRI